MATEYAAGNERFGKSNGVVGYHVGGEPRFDQHRCRIKFMTEALFLSDMLDQADLSRYRPNSRAVHVAIRHSATSACIQTWLRVHLSCRLYVGSWLLGIVKIVLCLR